MSSILRVRLDGDTDSQLFLLCGTRRTKSVVIRDLIYRAWKEMERSEASDRLRAGRADRVIALGEQAAKKAAWNAGAAERARLQNEQVEREHWARIERDRVAEEERLARDAEAERVRVAARDAALAEAHPWEMTRSDWTAVDTSSLEKFHLASIAKMKPDTVWTIRHKGVFMKSGVGPNVLVTAERAAG